MDKKHFVYFMHAAAVVALVAAIAEGNYNLVLTAIVFSCTAIILQYMPEAN